MALHQITNAPAAAEVGPVPRDVLASENNPSFLRFEVSENGFQQGRFPGAVGADDAGHFAIGNLDGYVLENGDVPLVSGAQVFNAKA